jgi:hypothetical protein
MHAWLETGPLRAVADFITHPHVKVKSIVCSPTAEETKN